MKRLLPILIIFSFIFFAYNALALVLAWDTYTDPNATGLRIESSIDQQNWSTLIDNITTTDIAASVPNHDVDYQRVYYRMRAFDATDVSSPSNVISYYWTTGGGGMEGVGTPGNVRFIDCSNPQNATEQQICTDLGQ